MESTVIVTIISVIGNVILGLLQWREYKAKAKKTNVEADSIEATVEQAREKQFFDQVMAFSSVSSQKLLESEEKRHKQETDSEEKIGKLESRLQECKDLKERLCEERLKLLKKVREYEPNYQTDNPAS